MTDRQHIVFAFYHVLTWYIAPIVYKRIVKDGKDVHAYFAGFLVSIALYEYVGKAYIEDKKGY